MSPKNVSNVRVGKADVKPTAPSHVRGVKEGNRAEGRKSIDAARRATGINTDEHEPIDPRMPKIPPA